MDWTGVHKSRVVSYALVIRTWKSALAGLTGLCVAALLAGCGAGQITATARKDTAIAGINAEVKRMAIRNAAVTYSPDIDWNKNDDVPLIMTLVNNAQTTDTLTKVESPISDKVLLVKAEYPPSATPTPESTSSYTIQTANPTASVSPTVTPTPGTPELGTAPNIPISVGEAVVLNGTKNAAQDAQYLILKKIKKTIRPVDRVKITLTFQHAGSITLDLPVAPPSSPRPRESLTHKGAEEGH